MLLSLTHKGHIDLNFDFGFKKVVPFEVFSICLVVGEGFGDI